MHIIIEMLKIIVGILCRMDSVTAEEKAKLHNKINLL